MAFEFTQVEYENSGSRQSLSLRCDFCKKSYLRTKHRVQDMFKRNKLSKTYCSAKCRVNGQVATVLTRCLWCRKLFKIQKHRLSKRGHFCTRSCRASNTNAHKQVGCRRSKLEVWLERELKNLFPTTNMIFNRRSVIASELDIYLPELRLAFEINGIFHYKPIYGAAKLKSIRANDSRKLRACLAHAITLCVINVSAFNQFKIATAEKYLRSMKTVIESKLVEAAGVEPSSNLLAKQVHCQQCFTPKKIGSDDGI